LLDEAVSRALPDDLRGEEAVDLHRRVAVATLATAPVRRYTADRLA